MRLSTKQYAKVLLELSEKGGDKEIKEQFLAWLSRRGEMRKLSAILAQAEHMQKVASGSVEVEIATAFDPDTSTQKKLESKAGKLFQGKNILARFVTDPSLIGGARLRSGEFLYDASLSAKVRALKKDLES